MKNNCDTLGWSSGDKGSAWYWDNGTAFVVHSAGFFHSCKTFCIKDNEDQGLEVGSFQIVQLPLSSLQSHRAKT